MGKKRVFYGAAFNPISYAHLLTAEIAGQRRGADMVHFVVSSDTRNDKEMASDEHRYEMVKLAVEDNDLFVADDTEIRNPAWESYTAITMDHMKKKYPEDDLYFLIGADNLAGLPYWPKGEQLVANNKFIVVARDNYDMLETIAKDPILREYEDHFDLLHKGIKQDMSSTFIRQELKAGRSANYMLPKSCQSYAKWHKLYK